jgi:hypothetical protein
MEEQQSLRLQADTLILYEGELYEKEKHLKECMLLFQRQTLEFIKLQEHFMATANTWLCQGCKHTQQQQTHNNDGWENVEVSQTFTVGNPEPHQGEEACININADYIDPALRYNPDAYYIRATEVISKLRDANGVKIKRSSKKTGHPIFVLFLYYILRPKCFYTEEWGLESRPKFENLSQVNAFCKVHRQKIYDFFEYIFTKGKWRKSKIVADQEIMPTRNIIRRYTQLIRF